MLVHRTGEVTVEGDACSLDPVERLSAARQQYQAHADALSGSAARSMATRASPDRTAGSERTDEKDLLIRDLQAENKSLRATIASLMASTGATLDDLASAQARFAARRGWRCGTDPVW